MIRLREVCLLFMRVVNGFIDAFADLMGDAFKMQLMSKCYVSLDCTTKLIIPL